MTPFLPNRPPPSITDLATHFDPNADTKSWFNLERARSYAERGNLAETRKWLNNFLLALGKPEADLSPEQKELLKQIVDTAEIKQIPWCLDQADKAAKQGDQKKTRELLDRAITLAEKQGIELNADVQRRIGAIYKLSEVQHLDRYLSKAREAAEGGLNFVCYQWLTKARFAFSDFPDRAEREKECSKIHQDSLMNRARQSMLRAIEAALSGSPRLFEEDLTQAGRALAATPAGHVLYTAEFDRGVNHLRRLVNVNGALWFIRQAKEKDAIGQGCISNAKKELEVALAIATGDSSSIVPLAEGTNLLQRALDELSRVFEYYYSGDRENFLAALGRVEQAASSEADALLNSLGSLKEADKLLGLAQGAGCSSGNSPSSSSEASC